MRYIKTLSKMQKILKEINKYNDLYLAIGIVFIILFFLIPIPKGLLDILLSFSISTSVMILMTTLLIKDPLDFNVFPSLLLITTLVRLSLNIASTRLILVNGHLGFDSAGKIISAFGKIVMQNNLVVGVSIFLILTIINFVVITKGSGRIAEVTARFNLDAMPGKQMSIDAELASGIINEKTAKSKRKRLEDKNSFYGAMDGANKFIRGDAIASVLITLVNIIGGIINATIIKGFSINTVFNSYFLLTVGDGLVSQIPALMISISSGLILTKSNSTTSTDKEIFSQIGQNPKAIILASIVSLILGLVPNIPFFPFFIISTTFTIISYILYKMQKRIQESYNTKELNQEGNTQKQETLKKEQQIIENEPVEALKLSLIKIELGLNVSSLVNKENTSLHIKLHKLRTQMASSLGFLLPKINLENNFLIEEDTYNVYIKECKISSEKIYSEKIFIINPKGNEVDLEGIKYTEPTYKIQGKWVEKYMREKAKEKGYNIIEPASLIMTNLSKIIKENITDLLSYTDTQNLLEEISNQHKKLVRDIVPEKVSITTVQKVLHNLLKENISIKDLSTILEAIHECYDKEISQMTRNVRSKLKLQICSMYSKNNQLNVITISQKWQDILIKSFEEKKKIPQFSLPFNQLTEFIQDIQKTLSKNNIQTVPVILTIPSIREKLKLVINNFNTNINVISQEEVHFSYKINHVGVIGEE